VAHSDQAHQERDVVAVYSAQETGQRYQLVLCGIGWLAIVVVVHYESLEAFGTCLDNGAVPGVFMPPLDHAALLKLSAY
jgi:hypothetical protein